MFIWLSLEKSGDQVCLQQPIEILTTLLIDSCLLTHLGLKAIHTAWGHWKRLWLLHLPGKFYDVWMEDCLAKLNISSLAGAMLIFIIFPLHILSYIAEWLWKLLTSYSSIARLLIPFGIRLKLLNYYSLLQQMFPLISLGFGIQLSMMPPMVSLLPGIFGKPEMTAFNSNH